MMKRHELGLTASEEEEYLIEFKSNHDDDIGGPPQERMQRGHIVDAVDLISSRAGLQDSLYDALNRIIPVALVVVVVLSLYSISRPSTVETTTPIVSSRGAAKNIEEFPYEPNQRASRRFLSSSSEARCIDGSTPAYYIRKGRDEGANKWVLHFEGGGWCYDLQACYLRSKTGLGSSKGYPDTMRNSELPLYLSDYSSVNPLMHNWNAVYVKYCDGASYAGDTVANYEGNPLFFRGALNRDETIRSLLWSEGMTSASEIVITGCSAGALGVYLGIDQMVDLIYSKGINSSSSSDTSSSRARPVIRALADSGFFLEYTSSFKGGTSPYEAVNKKTGFMDYANAMRDVFQFTNMSSGANSKCLKTHNHNPSDCVFAANLLPHIKTPIFLLQPKYDSWQIMFIYDQKYTVQGVNDFGLMTMLAINSSVFYKGHPGHGIFMDSCLHHCGYCRTKRNVWSENENFWSGNVVVSQRGKTSPAMAFAEWYHHGGSSYNVESVQEEINWFVQDMPFPCEECCRCDNSHL